MPANENLNARPDHLAICDFIDTGARVLDLGCGTGELLELLQKVKGASAQGVEIDEEKIYKCVEKGLMVFHGDIESGLGPFAEQSFDYVILNQSIQEVRDVDFLLSEAFRVGRRVVVGFPNLGHLTARCDLFFRGRSPVSKSLPHPWNDTPNVHFLTIKDFREYLVRRKIQVLAAKFFSNGRTVVVWPNLLSETAVFLLGAPLAV